MRPFIRLAVSCSVVALAGAVGGGQNPRDRHNTAAEHFTKLVLATGLGNPREVTWGPDRFLWVTERTAFRVTRIDPSTGAEHVALTIDDGSVGGSGRLALEGKVNLPVALRLSSFHATC